MAAFNLTAELNLRGPSNLNQVVSNIRRQLSTVTLDLNINPNTSRGIQNVTNNIRTLSTALRDAQTNAASLSSTLSNLVTNINNVGNATNNINAGFNRLNNQTRTAANGTREAASEMEEFGRQSALAVRRFAAFSVATGAIYGLVRALSSAYSEFVNFNREFVRLQQVTNSTAAGLSGLSQEITRLSTGLGVSSSELLNVSTTLAQAGLSASQTKTALEALAKSALAPSFDNLNDTVEGSIALMRQFGLSAGDLEGALGSINAVAARFAVEAGDIITAIQRTGGVFASASKGVSEGKDALNEFIAVFTSVRATTRESAETIATGLRTIFTRIQRGGTIQALKEFGIVLTDLQGKFVGPYEAVRRLSQGLQSLDPRDLRFSQIVEELGGFRQIGKVIPLIQQFATAQQALSVAQRGAGSLAADQAKAQEALAVKITKVREEFIALIRDIGQTQSFQNFVDVSLKLASALISVASSAKDVLPALTAIAAIRAIPAIGQYARGIAGGLGGRRRGFASGGMVPGSGSGDTVPAMLTPGEFVIRKKAVQSIGVDRLAALNKNGGGATRYFNKGGLVQRFGGGGDVQKLGNGADVEYLEGSALAALKQLAREFIMPISRKGGRRKVSFTTQKAVSISKNIPPELLEQIEKEGRLVSGTGLREDLPKGSLGLIVDKVVNVALAKAKREKAGQLKKTQGALTFSAAGLQRGPRPPKELRGKKMPDGEFSMKTPAYLAANPEFARIMGVDTGIKGGFLKQFEAQAKQKIFTSPKGLLDRFPKAKSELQNFRVSLEKQLTEEQLKTKKDPKVIKSLQDQIKKISTALQDIDKYVEGGSPANAGRASHFAWSMRQAIPESKEFANGGIVQKFKDGTYAKKIPFEDKVMSGMKSGKKYQFGLVGLRSGTSGDVKQKENFDIIKGKEPNTKKYPVTLYKATLAKGPKNTAQTNIENSIESGFASMVNNTASILSTQLGAGKNASAQKMQKILKGSPLTTVVGSVFEAALASLGGPYIDKTEKTKSMDFPLGLGPIANSFDIPSNIPTDATRTVGGSGKGTSQMKLQIKRFISAVEGEEFTKSFAKMKAKRLIEKKTTSESGQNAQSLLISVLDRIPRGQTVAAALGPAKTNEIIEEFGIARNKLNRQSLLGSGPQSTLAVLATKNKNFAKLVKRLNDALVDKKASGGQISGQDTVPALLTPGEFVINKQAAQRIGSSNLHKLNNADKIKGFNKGGSVGNVQSFAGGGLVQSFFAGGLVQAIRVLTQSLPQLARSVAQTIRVLPPNLPQGAGWLSGNAGTRAMGLPQSAGGRIRNAAFDPMSLVFGASLLGEGAGSAIGGRNGEAFSSAVSSGVGIGGVVASIIGFSNPLSAAATVIIGATSAIQAWNKSIRDSQISENNKKIENSGDALDKALQQLSASSTNAAANLDTIKSNINTIIQTEQQNIQTAEQDTNPGFFANLIERFSTAVFGAGRPDEQRMGRINVNARSQELLSQTKIGAETVTRTVSELMKKGSTFGQAVATLSGGDINKEREIRSRIAVGQRGEEITNIQAKIKQAQEDLSTAWDTEPIETRLKYLNQSLNIAIDSANKEFEKQQKELNKVSKAVAQVTESLRPFLQVMTNISAASSRASAEFQETQRQIDIGVGSAFGGETNIGPVSRLNENVLSNLRAYTSQEIGSTIDRFGARSGIDQGITNKVKSAALSQKVLDTELPRILQNIANLEATNQFGGDDRNTMIEKELKMALDKGGVKDESFKNQIINAIITGLGEATGGGGNKSLQDVLRDSGVLQKIMENNSSTIEQYSTLMKEQNDVLEVLNNRLNQYVSALELAINGQIQANQIRLQAENQLAETLGKNLSIGERNQPFNQEILGLTRNIDITGKPIEGTGTLSATEIAKRLEATEERKKQLEGTKGDKSPEKFAGELTQVTLQARQLETALKKLANDGTRAANALNKLQQLRQERFTRQNAFFDFASNANDPEFLNNFIGDFGSLARIISGGGGIQDVQGAIRAFQVRANAGFIPANQVEEERNKFGGMLAERFGLPKELIDMMFKQTQAETDAIADFRTAINEQAVATELAATRTKDSAQEFYNKILQAASDFLAKVGGASKEEAAAQKPAAANPARRATGGLIYANKGQLINFEPKGTDTVPAMLTPGEFVVNAKATKQNLGLLKQINNGNKISGFSKGGVVYLANGGSVTEKRKMSEEETAGIAAMIQDTTKAIQQYESETLDLEKISNRTPEQTERLNKLSSLINILFNRRNELLNRINLPNMISQKDFNNQIRQQEISNPQPLYEELMVKPMDRVNSIVSNYLNKRSETYSNIMEKLEKSDYDPSVLSPQERAILKKSDEGFDDLIAEKDLSLSLPDPVKEFSRRDAIELAQKNLRYEEKQKEAQNKPVPDTTNTPQSKFETERERRKQAFFSEQERRKQAAMSANPAYARKVARDEAKKREELTNAQEETGLADPIEALKVYRQRKRERIQYRNSQMAEADRNRARNKEQTPTETTPTIEPILSEAEVKRIEDETYTRITGKTKAEWEAEQAKLMQRTKDEADQARASLAAANTPEAKKEAEDRRNSIAAAEEEKRAKRAQWKKDMEERAARDAEARNKGYRDYAQQLGAEARQKAESDLELRKKSDEQKRSADARSIAEGKNAGRAKSQRLQGLLDSDPKYANQRKQAQLIFFLKERIDQQYGDDITDNPAKDAVNLERIVSSAEAEYYTEQRRLKDQDTKNKATFAKQNIATAAQQFGEGVDKSPILAAGMAIPRAGFGAIQTGASGAAFLTGKAMVGAGRLVSLAQTGKDDPTSNILGQFGAGLTEASAQGFEQGLSRIQLAGAAVGARAFGGDLGREYKLAEDAANQRITKISDTLANQSRGLYETDESTTLGQLLKPENIQRGAMNIAQVTGEGAIDASGAGGKLAQTAEAAIGKGLKATARAANRTLEGAGSRLVDVAEAYLPKPKPMVRPIENAAARRWLREGMPNAEQIREMNIRTPYQGFESIRPDFTFPTAATLDAAEQAIPNARIAAEAAEQARKADDTLNRTRVSMRNDANRIAQAVARGQETTDRFRRLGLEPPNFGNPTTVTTEAATTAAARQTLEEETRLAAEAVANFERTSMVPQAGAQTARRSAADAAALAQNKNVGSRAIQEAVSQPVARNSTQTARSSAADASALVQNKNAGADISKSVGQAKPTGTQTSKAPTLSSVDYVDYYSAKYKGTPFYDEIRKLLAEQQLVYGNFSGMKADIDINRRNVDEALKKLRDQARAAGFSHGGIVYASKGSLIPYQPRGTDTVPAMLTPGEFVVNKKAAQQNRGLLQAINSNKVQKFSKGGSVQYFQQGSDGAVQAAASGGSSSMSLDSSEFSTSVNNFNNAVGSLSSSLGAFSGVANTLASAMGGMGTAAGTLSTAASILASSAQNLSSPIQDFKKSLDSIGAVLSKIPSEINFKVSGSIPVVVTVDVNGGEGLATQLQPFANQIFTKVAEGIRRATNGNLNVEISSELT